MWAKFVVPYKLNNICRYVYSISITIVVIEIATIILILGLVYSIWRWESSEFFLFDTTFDSQFSSWSFECCHSLCVYCWLHAILFGQYIELVFHYKWSNLLMAYENLLIISMYVVNRCLILFIYASIIWKHALVSHDRCSRVST